MKLQREIIIRLTFKIPLQIHLLAQSSALLMLQILPQRMSFIAVHFDLRIQIEPCAEIVDHELLDLWFRPRLLKSNKLLIMVEIISKPRLT